MNIKSKLMEFVVVHDLIPVRLRWIKSARGVGRMFNDIFCMLDKDGKKKLGKILYDMGVNDADEFVKKLKIERNLHGCAIASIAANSLFGIKSYIAEENNDEIIIHATKCLWKDKKNWTPEVCASIEEYDIGLVEGINKNVKYCCTKRRSKGDKFCEVILTKR
ncbi:MAG: hypothetical protein CVT88_07230 [Candidatus Altiarchaeales archaeon HGW-Altiarchaeales-1]|nr:MAG: hypothetical protein CVT88_07230 [Candidatus Altiarchaeales archaeon HGW-Altiarchaeales-1]